MSCLPDFWPSSREIVENWKLDLLVSSIEIKKQLVNFIYTSAGLHHFGRSC
jgi:hypothetical protein